MFGNLLLKSSKRYNHLQLAQKLLGMEEGIKKEHLREKFDRDVLLSETEWTQKELNLLIKILYNFNQSIPVEMLVDIGHDNPQMLVRILVNDFLKPNPVQEFKPKFISQLIQNMNQFFHPEMYQSTAVNVAVIGDTNVGKQKLAETMLGKKTKTSSLLMMGSEFSYLDKPVKFNGRSLNLSYHFWRMNPQDASNETKKNFFSNAEIALVVFDLTNPVSFLKAIRWIEDIYEHNRKMVIPIALVGNKSDLRSVYSMTSLPIEIATINIYLERLNQKLGFKIPYIEISAKTTKGKDLLMAYLLNFYEYIFHLKSFKDIKSKELNFTTSIRDKFISTGKKFPNLNRMIMYLKRNTRRLQN